MNLLEHYIKEIHNVDDVTDKFEEKNGYPPNESIYRVDLTYICYGQTQRTTRIFYKSEWEDVKSKGYFMA